MSARRLVPFVTLCLVLGLMATSAPQAEQGSVRMYNTAKVKLMAGEQIVGGTVSTADPDIYCAMANAGYDFIWIEMQHSPLTFQNRHG